MTDAVIMLLCSIGGAVVQSCFLVVGLELGYRCGRINELNWSKAKWKEPFFLVGVAAVAGLPALYILLISQHMDQGILAIACIWICLASCVSSAVLHIHFTFARVTIKKFTRDNLVLNDEERSATASEFRRWRWLWRIAARRQRVDLDAIGRLLM